MLKQLKAICKQSFVCYVLKKKNKSYGWIESVINKV